MAILSRLRDLKSDSKEDSGKPKVKEAETINLPEFPNPESYRSWKTATTKRLEQPLIRLMKLLRSFKRIQEAYDKDANHESLRDPGKFLTLERGELSRETDQYFKTNEEVGSLYSVEDLLKVRLLNDDLSTFINNWESVMSGLSHTPDETTLRDILLRELRQSKRLKYDLEIYDRARP